VDNHNSGQLRLNATRPDDDDDDDKYNNAQRYCYGHRCVSESCQKCLESTTESSGREFQTVGQVTEKVSYFHSNVCNHGCGCCSWIQMMYRWRMQWQRTLTKWYACLSTQFGINSAEKPNSWLLTWKLYERCCG